MKKLIIIGAGGMGREIYDLATRCKGFNKEYLIKGFLDDSMDPRQTDDSYPPVINKIDDYIIESDDVFVCSIGNVSIKKNIIELICAKGGKFISLIHPNAFIGNNAKIGKGCIVLQNATIGVDAEVGDYVLVQISAIIGHDTIIGDFSRIDCFAICVGGVVIQRQVTLHTAAIINHNVHVGMNSIIGAGSFVIRKVKENTTVFGNPAVRLK